MNRLPAFEAKDSKIQRFKNFLFHSDFRGLNAASIFYMSLLAQTWGILKRIPYLCVKLIDMKTIS
jgi:hypothetical protein